MHFYRYQLSKTATKVVQSGHPWVFRDHLSSAADVFENGACLQLFDGSNVCVGFGVYEKSGLIAIRVLRTGAAAPDSDWLKGVVSRAIDRRKQLRNYTNAFRVLHGENDGLPGVVCDCYDKTLILQTYVPSMDLWGRAVEKVICKELDLKGILWRMPSKRQGVRTSKLSNEEAVRIAGLDGAMSTELADTEVVASDTTKGRPPSIDVSPSSNIPKSLSPSDERAGRILFGYPQKQVTVKEGKLEFKADLQLGQKGGAFLDLRGLRKWMSQQNLKGKRVLNLFSYTGTLSLAAQTAGAKEVLNVDISKGALDFGKKYHLLRDSKTEWVVGDVFQWINGLDRKMQFDLIICDPPSMAALQNQVPQALATYRRMYKKLREHILPSGKIVGVCCTSRITRGDFRTSLENAFAQQLVYERTLEHEDDHPVSIPEGDYLKILIYRRK